MTFPVVALDELVDAAIAGDPRAWNAIVDRYAPIVWSVCRRFRLSDADAADVSQTVWLRTIERLETLRDPAAFPGWLSTVARRECIRSATEAHRRPWSLDAAVIEVPADEDTTAPDEDLLRAERRAMLQEAFAGLPPRCQQLLSLIFGTEPCPYAEISARLGMPAGSIGPTRSRCLDRLRSTPVVQQWIAEPDLQVRGQNG